MELKKEWNGLWYLEYRPKGFDAEKKYPVLMYLHGAGERGVKEFELLKFHGPIKEAENGMNLDIAMSGIGSNSCGPMLDEKYRAPKFGRNKFRICFCKIVKAK